MKKTRKNSSSSSRMLWSQMQDFYKGEWVEIVDCKWSSTSPFPIWGRVRNHASDRTELIARVREDSAAQDSIVLYLGAARSTFEHSLSVAV